MADILYTNTNGADVNATTQVHSFFFKTPNISGTDMISYF